MNVLAVDTSSRNGAVGLCVEGSSFFSSSLPSSEAHSAQLLPAIEKLLLSQNLSVNEIDGYGIVLGPGSFTGLRIGLACVKALAWANRKPIVGLSSLEVLASALPETELFIAPMLNSRKGMIVAAIFRKLGDKLENYVAPAEFAPQSFMALLNNPTLCLGDASRTHRDLLRSPTSNIEIASEEYDHPKGEILARLTYTSLAQGQRLNLDTVEPIYLRANDAEPGMNR